MISSGNRTPDMQLSLSTRYPSLLDRLRQYGMRRLPDCWFLVFYTWSAVGIEPQAFQSRFQCLIYLATCSQCCSEVVSSHAKEWTHHNLFHTWRVRSYIKAFLMHTLKQYLRSYHSYELLVLKDFNRWRVGNDVTYINFVRVELQNITRFGKTLDDEWT